MSSGASRPSASAALRARTCRCSPLSDLPSRRCDGGHHSHEADERDIEAERPVKEVVADGVQAPVARGQQHRTDDLQRRSMISLTARSRRNCETGAVVRCPGLSPSVDTRRRTSSLRGDADAGTRARRLVSGVRRGTGTRARPCTRRPSQETRDALRPVGSPAGSSRSWRWSSGSFPLPREHEVARDLPVDVCHVVPPVRFPWSHDSLGSSGEASR